MDINTAIISGLLSLLGVFAGAFLARTTEHEKWLRNEQSRCFAEFLRQARSFQTKAIDITHSQLPLQQRDIAITELFMEVETHKQVVRLYLDPRNRRQFEDLTTELRVALAPGSENTWCIQKFEPALKDIQSIFEMALDNRHARYWNRRVV